jgi:hypothetical protein
MAGDEMLYSLLLLCQEPSQLLDQHDKLRRITLSRNGPAHI